MARPVMDNLPSKPTETRLTTTPSEASQEFQGDGQPLATVQPALCLSMQVRRSNGGRQILTSVGVGTGLGACFGVIAGAFVGAVVIGWNARDVGPWTAGAVGGALFGLFTGAVGGAVGGGISRAVGKVTIGAWTGAAAGPAAGLVSLLVLIFLILKPKAGMTIEDLHGIVVLGLVLGLGGLIGGMMGGWLAGLLGQRADKRRVD